MKMPSSLISIYFLLFFSAFGFISRAYAFSEQKFLLKEAEEKFKISVKPSESPENDQKLKVILLKEFLLSQYFKENPGALEESIKRYQGKGSIFIIDVPHLQVKILNVSDRRCSPSRKPEYTVDVSRLAKEFCFSAENVAYFSGVKEAKFRLIPILSVDSITDPDVLSELKIRMKEEIKAQVVREYIKKHKGLEK